MSLLSAPGRATRYRVAWLPRDFTKPDRWQFANVSFHRHKWVALAIGWTYVTLGRQVHVDAVTR